MVSEHPLRQFEVNEAAWLVLNVLDGSTPLHQLVESPTRELVAFLEHKATVGLLSASYHVVAPPEWPQVAVVIPVYGNLPGLRRCLEALGGLRYPREKYSVIVVDDATPFSLLDELHGNDFGGLTTSWLHLKTNMGPATARNAAAGFFPVPVPDRSTVATPPAEILAFVDSDCVPTPHWLQTLVPVLEDPLIGAVGGRVAGLSRHSLLARYEADCASLNMGGGGGEAGLPHSRIPYLPTCNLLVKRRVFGELSGFRAGMRLGEDVEFCWRLAAAGQGLFYFPGGEVYHDYRARWAPFLNRKRAYAFSESWLRRGYPAYFQSAGRIPFLIMLVLTGLALILQNPVMLGAAFAPLLGARLVGLWRNRGVFRSAGPLRALMAALRGTAGEWLQQCRWFARHTLILWFPLVAVYPGLVSIPAIVLGLGVVGEWLSRRPAGSVFGFAIGFAGDCLAYSFGRVQGELYAVWCRLRGRPQLPAA